MESRDTIAQRFTVGFKTYRDTEYASKEIVPHQGPDWYWVPSTGQWWQRGQFWHEKDVGLESLGERFIGKAENLFELMNQGWERVKMTQPDAVWNPYTFKFVVVYQSVPAGSDGPVANKPIPPRPEEDRLKLRRIERDRRTAEVRALYAKGDISAALRDSRLSIILAEYPDLN